VVLQAHPKMTSLKLNHRNSHRNSLLCSLHNNLTLKDKETKTKEDSNNRAATVEVTEVDVVDLVEDVEVLLEDVAEEDEEEVQEETMAIMVTTL